MPRKPPSGPQASHPEAPDPRHRWDRLNLSARRERQATLMCPFVIPRRRACRR